MIEGIGYSVEGKGWKVNGKGAQGRGFMISASQSPILRTYELISLPAFWPPGLPAFYLPPSHRLTFFFLPTSAFRLPNSTICHLYNRSTS